MRLAPTIVLLGTLGTVMCQQIYDIWQTTRDKQKLFIYSQPETPIDFVKPGPIGSADIVVDDSAVYQTVYGFGAALTDSSAYLLNTLKSQNPTSYWQLMDKLFNTTDGSNSASFSYLRVPLGATDFSTHTYSYADTDGDVDLNSFDIDAAPSYLFSILNDILSVNAKLKVHVLPWSPPRWMKDGTMNGGSLNTEHISTMAKYLLKCLQGFSAKGISVYAITIQNEPENGDPTYPTCSMSVSVEAQIGTALRSLMDENGFSNVKIFGYEHNWAHAGDYPVQLMQQAGNTFGGTTFHCYEGTASDQDLFTSQYPDKEVLVTECTGSLNSDWWDDSKWYMNSLIIDSINHGSSAVLLWNLALDSSGGPELPGSDSCSGGCRGVVEVNDGSWSLNQEFYAMAHASKAVLPRDSEGPWGQRIGVSVGGDFSWALVVAAFVTRRFLTTDWDRYGLVVLNWDDNAQDQDTVTATIEFRGMQAKYAFPPGVTTLLWYAPPHGEQ